MGEQTSHRVSGPKPRFLVARHLGGGKTRILELLESGPSVVEGAGAALLLVLEESEFYLVRVPRVIRRS